MSQMNSEITFDPLVDDTSDNTARKKGFIGLASLIAIACAGYGTYWYLFASHYITTDNAYTSTEIAEVTPAVGGIVKAVNVIDTQQVKKGDVLVVIDDTDAKLALAQAEAEVGLAKRRILSYQANDEGFAAQVSAQEAENQRAQANLSAALADLARAEIDMKRREALFGSGSVSGEELTNSKNALAQAQAQLSAAKAAVAQTSAGRLSVMGSKKANAALINDTTVENNPEVLLAKARYNQAKIDLERTLIKAPIDGVVAKRQVQIGRRVQISAPLLYVVPINEMHVDANFKEVELRDVKIGQPVEVTADLYGDKTVYHGVVSGLSSGTGSAFSMIPAQNATGNWIKVVQRLPVRITLNPQDLINHPLQVGLSMKATIDTKTEPLSGKSQD